MMSPNHRIPNMPNGPRSLNWKDVEVIRNTNTYILGMRDYNKIQKGLPADGMYFTCSIAAAAWAIKVAPEGWFDTQRSICRSASAAGDQTLLLRTWWSPMNIVYDHHIWWLCKIIRSYMITRRGHWELASPNTKQNTAPEPNAEHNLQ